MAPIATPRQILGERDVNKPLSTSSSTNKAAPYIQHNVLEQKSLCREEYSQPLLTPEKHKKSPSNTPISSPSNTRKRGAACLDDALDCPPRKQTLISLPQESSDGTQQLMRFTKTRPFQRPLDETQVKAAVAESRQHNGGPLRYSVSPNSSFDTTQDSELFDSQITNITEPEDTGLAGISLPLLTTASIRVIRVFSQEESRENAEALRLRLQVAMYKVKTNQTDLPLYKLQIRSSRTHSCVRTLLPNSKLVSTAGHDMPAASTSHVSPIRHDGAEDHTSLHSSSSPVSTSPDRPLSQSHIPRRDELATPVLPRSRHGNLNFSKRGSPEPGFEVTNSVIKGRAANSLLSLMEGGGRHD